jgi:hypothetical protein
MSTADASTPKPQPINDGGPAFPVCYQHENLETGEKEVTAAFHGITMRDWFAGQALANRNIEDHCGPNWAIRVAEQAYRIADAMLAEREKGKR